MKEFIHILANRYHNLKDESTIVGIPIVIIEWFTKTPFDKESSALVTPDISDKYSKLTHLEKSQLRW